VSATAPAKRRGRKRLASTEAILDAARAVFLAEGYRAAGMRAIAAKAGLAVGSLYTYFPDKAALVGELVERILGEMAQAVRGGIGRAQGATARLRAGPLAMLDFFGARPLDFALFQALRKGELPEAVERRLNGRLIAALTPMANAIAAASGLPPKACEAEAVARLAAVVGALLLDSTGRLAALGQTPAALVAHDVDSFAKRFEDRR